MRLPIKRVRESPGDLAFNTKPVSDWPDSEFIAHARTDVPALIAALRRSWAENADLKAALAETVKLAKAAMLAEGEWRPIEEAPKDGTPVVVYVPDARRGRYQRQVGWCGLTADGTPLWVIGGLMGFDVGKPTHFRPLPAPPISPEARAAALNRLAELDAEML